MPNNGLQPSTEAVNGGKKADMERLIKLKKCCSGIESIFIGTLLKALRATIPESNLLPQSAGKNIYDSMFDQQFSIFLTQAQGIGLADTLYRQMLRQEEFGLLQNGTVNQPKPYTKSNQNHVSPLDENHGETLKKGIPASIGKRIFPADGYKPPDSSPDLIGIYPKIRLKNITERI
ncbi:MAG: rod-binding protein [Deltaproteobacteria bacterium]|nr:rod-binding protein [Deltaproteobacteria bacterium]